MKYFGWIFLFFIVVFIIPLGSRPMLAPEEFIQAEIAREMVASGNYTLPSLFNEVQIGRFPMSSWLMAGCFKLFGVNAFAARLPAAAAVGLTALLIAWFIQQTMRDEKLAALSALIYMAFSVTIFTGSTAQYPAVFTFFAATALGMGFLASQEEKINRRKVLLIFLSGIFAGAAFLTGGLAGVVLPVVIFLLYLLCNHRYKELLIIPLPCLISAALPVLPYLLKAEKLQDGFCAEFFSWGRFSAGIGTFSPWYTYLLYFFIGLLPVAVLLPAAMMAGKEAWQKLFRQPLCRFALLAVIVPPVYLAFMRNVEPGGVLLSFPALAILVAMGLQAYFNAGGHHRSFDWMLNIWALFLVITGCIEVVFWFLQERMFQEYLSVLPVSELFLINLAVPSLIGGGVILYSLRGNWRSRLYLFFFSVAILPLGISWCLDTCGHMPEATFRDLVSQMDIIAGKSVFITRSEFSPAVAWSTGGKIIVMDKDNELCCEKDVVCVILKNDDPAWRDLPRPERISSKGEFTCALFRSCVMCEAK